jgi:hypothetical protein
VLEQQLFIIIIIIIIHLFTCACIVWVISPSCPLPLPFQAEIVHAFLQFCGRVEISNNKKDIAFLLVEIRAAIQRDS